MGGFCPKGIDFDLKCKNHLHVSPNFAKKTPNFAIADLFPIFNTMNVLIVIKE